MPPNPEQLRFSANVSPIFEKWRVKYHASPIIFKYVRPLGRLVISNEEIIKLQLNSLGLPQENLYKALSMFMLTTQQRRNCGYPMVDWSTPGKVEFFDNKYAPAGEAIKCGLCMQMYCASKSSPCSKPMNNFAHAPLKVVVNENDRFVRTQPRRKFHRRVVAMDCEMCVTTKGLELARVTLVNINGDLVYDRFVRPKNRIVNYNTEYSGIAPCHLASVTTTLADVQRELLMLIDSSTIIIGHGLENDLKALQLVHNYIIDTSVVFPDSRGVPYKRSLKSVALEELNIRIQNNPLCGHDSCQDAFACILLMIHKLQSHSNLRHTMNLYTYYEPLSDCF